MCAEDHRTRLTETSVIEQIVSSLENFKWDCAVYCEAVGALRFICLDCEKCVACNSVLDADQLTFSLTAHAEARVSGGICLDLVIQGMKRFAKVPIVQERSTNLFLLLSSFDRNLGRLLKRGVLGRLLSAMKQHMKAPQIQEHALGIILNMALRRRLVNGYKTLDI